MKNCIDTSSGDYQQLRQSVGNSLSEFKFRAYTQAFYTKHNRLPKLHEIPGASSKEYLINTLQAKSTPLENKYKVKEQDLISYTGEDIRSAIRIINSKHTDLEVSYSEDPETGDPIVLDGYNFISIRQKPGFSEIYKDFQEIRPQRKEDDKIALRIALDKLLKNYGIDIIYAESEELEELLKNEVQGNVPSDLKTVKGFILNGKIYINSSLAGLNTPIHELMHIFIGAIKFQDRNLYENLLQLVADRLSQIENWQDKLAPYYKNRTMNDILEEVLVKDYSNWITKEGTSLIFDGLSEEEQGSLQYEILENIQLMLDRLLFGSQSVTSIPKEYLYVNSLNTLISTLGSNMTDITSLCSLSTEHRRLSNVKQSLMEGKGPLNLKEECI